MLLYIQLINAVTEVGLFRVLVLFTTPETESVRSQWCKETIEIRAVIIMDHLII